MPIKILKNLAIWVLLSASTASAQEPQNTDDNVQPEAYITEDLYIFMHAGPGRQYRILGSVNAAEPITVVTTSDDGEYTEIRSKKQRTGWVESKFISATPGQRKLIPTLKAEIVEQQATIDGLAANNSQLNAQNNNHQKRIKTLNETLGKLRDDLKTANTNLQNSHKNDSKEWLLKGGGLTLFSVFFGYILSILPKRKKRRNDWA